MKNLSIAILVLFYEKAEQTIECLACFENSGVNIYLLDNGSSVESKKLLARYVKDNNRIKIIEESHNVGVGPGRNVLIKSSREEWLFFVDNDIVVETVDWLDRIISYIEAYPHVEAFVPRLYNWHERQWVVYSDLEISSRQLRRKALTGNAINNFPGGAAIVRRSLFDRLGLYDEMIFVGGEDYELCLRGLLCGEPVRGMLVDDICLVHKHLTANDPATRTAARVRYDFSTIAGSMKYIEEKHGVTVQTGWELWTAKKLKLMTRGESMWDWMKRYLTIFKRRVFPR